MSRLRTNRVCFTINNYELDTIDKFIKWFDIDKNIIYGIVGQEIGDNGTPHLQGFINYNIDRKKGGINFWKKLIPEGERAHLEPARGTDENSKDYCSKEGIFLEVGKPTENNKWTTVVETAKTDLQAALAIDSELTLKYYFQIKKIYEDSMGAAKMDATLPELRDWQKAAIENLTKQDDRKILFIVDKEGGKGKSALAKHLLTKYNTWACQGKLT